MVHQRFYNVMTDLSIHRRRNEKKCWSSNTYVEIILRQIIKYN